MHTLALACLGLMLAGEQTVSKEKTRPLQIEDLYKFARVGDPRISPDGKHVAYAVTTVDLEGNKSSSAIWVTPTDGGEPKALTTSGKRDAQPRWSPDGKSILFVSNRGGSNQLWLIATTGGEAKQLTTISTGAGDPVWSRDGKRVAFASAVYPEYSAKPFKESDALNKKRLEEVEKNPVKARVFSRLFYRHWDSYVEDKRQHLFVLSLEGEGATPRDVTPGDRDAVPTSTTFATGDDFTFSPDGKFLLYTATPGRDEAWSTNFDILRVSVEGGKPEALTKDNPAADGGPRFSPDGKKLLYRAQTKPGSEADRWHLYVVDCDASGAFTGKPHSITKDFDRSPDSFVWEADGKSVILTGEEAARTPVWKVDLSGGEVTKLLEGHTNGNLSISADGKRLAFTRVAMTFPAEVFVADLGEGVPTARNVSTANAKFLATLDMPKPESVTVKGAGGTPMQMWILKPPGFDAKKKWPVAYLVHGGPQGAWEDGWSFRWCPEVWAARGYVVALPNPRGSTGFGQKYVDEISGDWGGKCYEDLMKGVDYVESLPYVDKDRIGTAGASFGGYMMNWFSVNTGRFKCLITHCSVWNFESMWGTTDELWFDEQEHGGLPWEVPGKYAEYSPHKKAANLKKFKTPMLVIHNDLDFRCPIGQGHELFTTLQRLRVPSRMINFPDEGHWVAKPKNGAFWHKEVFAWLEKYAPPGGR